MAKYVNSTERRLHSMIEFHRLGVASKLMELAGIKNEPLPLDNPDVWAAVARSVLTLGDGDDDALKKAFEAFDLDPRDPSDWRYLVSRLASVLFAEPARSGRPAEWNTQRYCELLEAVDRRKQKNPSLSDERACAQIASDKRSPAYLRKAGRQGLRKELRKARSPEYNDAVRILVDAAISGGQRFAKSAVVEWSKIESLWATEMSKDAAQFIGSRWRRRDETA